MLLGQWDDPRPGSRGELVERLLADLSGTERATFVVGDGDAERFVVAADIGVLALAWEPGPGGGRGTFSGALTPWNEVRGIELRVAYLRDEWGGDGAVRRIRIVATVPLLDLADSERHPGALAELWQELVRGAHRSPP